jgi:hypothetical protein
LPQDASLSDTITRVNELSVQKVGKIALQRKLDDAKDDSVSTVVGGAPTSADTLKKVNDNLTAGFQGLSGTIQKIPIFQPTQSLDYSVIEKLIRDAIDGERKIMNTDQTIYADGVMGRPVPNSPFGWIFDNKGNDGKKINWYYYSKDSNIFARKVALNELKNMYCIINYLEGNVENPFFIAYTTKMGDGQDKASWYRNKIFYGSNDLPADCDKTKPIFLYTGTDPKIHPEIPASNRQQLQLNSTLCNPTSLDNAQVAAISDEVSAFSLQTSSQAVSYSNYHFVCLEMGFIATKICRENICVSSPKLYNIDFTLKQESKVAVPVGGIKYDADGKPILESTNPKSIEEESVSAD